MKTAAILVGGKGTRLQSLVSDVPKPIAKIAGEPFLFLILRALQLAGITRVVLLTGYMHEKIIEACGDGNNFNLEILYSQEHVALGTAGAVKNAEIYLKNTKEFLLLNGDTFFPESLDKLIQFPLDENLALIGVTEPNEENRYGSIVLQRDSLRIQSFNEKQSSQDESVISAGVYKFSEKILDFIPANQNCSLETDIFPQLLKSGHAIEAVKLSGQFCDIGLPDSYVSFNLQHVLSLNQLDAMTKSLFSLFLLDENNILQNKILMEFLKN